MPATPADTLLSDTACFGCLGMSLADQLLLAEWSLIAENIAPVGDLTILTELGIDLMDEAGAALLIE